MTKIQVEFETQGVSLPKELFEWVRKAASERDQTVSAFLRQLIREQFEAQKKGRRK